METEAPTPLKKVERVAFSVSELDTSTPNLPDDAVAEPPVHLSVGMSPDDFRDISIDCTEA